MYCEGKAKGKVIYKNQGQETEVIINNPPFNVGCSPSGSCGVTGLRTITYNVANPASSPQTGRQYSNASYKDEVWFFKAVPSTPSYDGNRYDLYGNCHGVERLIFAGFSVFSGAITITNNSFQPSGDDGLVITDANDNILFAIPVSECNYTIACDANCPDGYCECPSDVYPGYCCQPCKATAAKLNTITQMVKRVNNGK